MTTPMWSGKLYQCPEEMRINNITVVECKGGVVLMPDTNIVEFMNKDITGINLGMMDFTKTDMRMLRGQSAGCPKLNTKKCTPFNLTAFLATSNITSMEEIATIVQRERCRPVHNCIDNYIVGPNMNLSYVNMDGWNLENVTLTNSDLSNAYGTLEKCPKKGLGYICLNNRIVGLGADITNTNFSNVDVTGVDFSQYHDLNNATSNITFDNVYGSVGGCFDLKTNTGPFFCMQNRILGPGLSFEGIDFSYETGIWNMNFLNVRGKVKACPKAETKTGYTCVKQVFICPNASVAHLGTWFDGETFKDIDVSGIDFEGTDLSGVTFDNIYGKAKTCPSHLPPRTTCIEGYIIGAGARGWKVNAPVLSSTGTLDLKNVTLDNIAIPTDIAIELQFSTWHNVYLNRSFTSAELTGVTGTIHHCNQTLLPPDVFCTPTENNFLILRDNIVVENQVFKPNTWDYYTPLTNVHFKECSFTGIELKAVRLDGTVFEDSIVTNLWGSISTEADQTIWPDNCRFFGDNIVLCDGSVIEFLVDFENLHANLSNIELTFQQGFKNVDISNVDMGKILIGENAIIENVMGQPDYCPADLPESWFCGGTPRVFMGPYQTPPYNYTLTIDDLTEWVNISGVNVTNIHFPQETNAEGAYQMNWYGSNIIGIPNSFPSEYQINNGHIIGPNTDNYPDDIVLWVERFNVAQETLFTRKTTMKKTQLSLQGADLSNVRFVDNDLENLDFIQMGSPSNLPPGYVTNHDGFLLGPNMYLSYNIMNTHKNEYLPNVDGPMLSADNCSTWHKNNAQWKPSYRCFSTKAVQETVNKKKKKPLSGLGSMFQRIFGWPQKLIVASQLNDVNTNNTGQLYESWILGPDVLWSSIDETHVENMNIADVILSTPGKKYNMPCFLKACPRVLPDKVTCVKQTNHSYCLLGPHMIATDTDLDFEGQEVHINVDDTDLENSRFFNASKIYMTFNERTNFQNIHIRNVELRIPNNFTCPVRFIPRPCDDQPITCGVPQLKSWILYEGSVLPNNVNFAGKVDLCLRNLDLSNVNLNSATFTSPLVDGTTFPDDSRGLKLTERAHGIVKQCPSWMPINHLCTLDNVWITSGSNLDNTRLDGVDLSPIGFRGSAKWSNVSGVLSRCPESMPDEWECHEYDHENGGKALLLGKYTDYSEYQRLPEMVQIEFVNFEGSIFNDDHFFRSWSGNIIGCPEKMPLEYKCVDTDSDMENNFAILGPYINLNRMYLGKKVTLDEPPNFFTGIFGQLEPGGCPILSIGLINAGFGCVNNRILGPGVDLSGMDFIVLDNTHKQYPKLNLRYATYYDTYLIEDIGSDSNCDTFETLLLDRCKDDQHCAS
jgi:uncharacterized protein YjbI with pentapeptide repeats